MQRHSSVILIQLKKRKSEISSLKSLLLKHLKADKLGLKHAAYY